MLGTVEMDAVPHMGSHETKRGGEPPCSPASHAPCDEAQNTIGFVGSEYTLLTDIEFLSNQHSQCLLPEALIYQKVPTRYSLVYFLAI